MCVCTGGGNKRATSLGCHNMTAGTTTYQMALVAKHMTVAAAAAAVAVMAPTPTKQGSVGRPAGAT